MEHYAGIDVALEQSSVCVVDATGKIVCETKVASGFRQVSRQLAVGREIEVEQPL